MLLLDCLHPRSELRAAEDGDEEDEAQHAGHRAHDQPVVDVAANTDQSLTIIYLDFFSPSASIVATFCRGHVEHEESQHPSKFRRYADQSTRHTKTSQFDFFDDVSGKKMHEMSEDLSLKRSKVLNLRNKQSTILCVSRQQIFIILCEFSPRSPSSRKPP